MNTINMNLDELAGYFNLTIDELKDKTIKELESLEAIKKAAEAQADMDMRANSSAFAELIKKYFTPFEYLTQWFTEEEIIESVIRQGITEEDLCSEFANKTNNCYYKPNEYLGQKGAYFDRYTRSGERLADMEYVKNAYVFRIRNQYQHLCHGKVMLDLLYSRYPELKKYQFEAYGYELGNHHPYGYEIYPKGEGVNGIYTPYTALIEGDIDVILGRNLSYAKQYNFGAYTQDATEERLASPAAEEYFAVIKDLDRDWLQDMRQEQEESQERD